MAGHVGLRWGAGALACLLMAAFVIPAMALPDPVLLATSDIPLPVAVQAQSTVWDGTFAYLFGGYVRGGGTTATIWRFDAKAGTIQEMPFGLPSPRGATSAVWTGAAAFIFGGSASGSQQTDEILRFDPGTGVRVVAHLPFPRDWTSAVWVAGDPLCSAGCAYVFGGARPGGSSDEIVRFDPVSQRATVAANLPRILWGSSAFFDPTPTAACPAGCAFVVGGSHVEPGASISTVSERTEILRFEPQSSSVTYVASLPEPQADAGVIWDGHQAWLFGGHQNRPKVLRDHVLLLDPNAEQFVQETCLRLPSGRGYHSTVWTGEEGYILGGQTIAAEPDPSVLRFDPKAPCLLGLVPVVVLPVALQVPVFQERRVAAPGVALVYKSGGEPLQVVADVYLASDPSELPVAVPPPSAEVIGTYLQAEGEVKGEGVIRIEMQADAAMIAAGSDPTILYYNGTSWIDLRAALADGVVHGSGTDLRVLGSGYDSKSGLAWVEVNHTSTYVLVAPTSATDSTSRLPAGHASSGAPAWLVAGIATMVAVVVSIGVTLVVVALRKGKRGPQR